jgi:hypothetical protein
VDVLLLKTLLGKQPKADGVSQSALIKALSDHIDCWGLYLSAMICAASDRPIAVWFAVIFSIAATCKWVKTKKVT